jgi:[ribosomal protein S18]-alanine N-acetyltransferase
VEQEDISPQGVLFCGGANRTVENTHFWPCGKRERVPLSSGHCSAGAGGQAPNVRGLYNVAVATVVRDYKSEDFESLWRMDQACFPPGISYSRRELRDFVRHRGSFTLVATNEKAELQGFIVGHCGKTGHIVTIDVDPSARRSGVGSLLLRNAEDRIRASGCRAVGLETAVDNATALAFYKRHGYNVIRTWPRYYSTGVDALVLKKDLN